MVVNINNYNILINKTKQLKFINLRYFSVNINTISYTFNNSHFAKNEKQIINTFSTEMIESPFYLLIFRENSYY